MVKLGTGSPGRARRAVDRALRTALCGIALTLAAGPAPGAEPEDSPARTNEFGEPEEDSESERLRERLTEREDENRVEDPWTTEVWGRTLTVSGQYEAVSDLARRTVVGPGSSGSQELLVEQELEVELFYSLGSSTFLFAQALLGTERAASSPSGVEGVESSFVERGEMWLYFRRLGGRPFDLEIGRLDFEDDRTWWFDDELDALRLTYELDEFDVSLAAARELAPRRTDPSRIEPEHERVLRWIGEMSWDWRGSHSLELFGIRQSDHSPLERIGSIVSEEREDDSDASLTWLGLRAMGAWSSPARGIVGYWADVVSVSGRETAIEYAELPGERSLVDDHVRRDVRGWAVDSGLTWIVRAPLEPRLTLGIAVGSGDSSPDSGSDRSFRQTGLGSNESGFGGVERFHHYGFLLQPELSNLRILTVGAGVSLFESSSLDLVYHDYRQVSASTSLRDARLELELSGTRTHVGRELDLVLGLEEWDRFEATLVLSAFDPGSAPLDDEHDWTYGAFLSLRYAF